MRSSARWSTPSSRRRKRKRTDLAITPIRLVALDLDGTTLGPDHSLLDRTREAIFAARANGVQVVLVTGRMYQSSAPVARELKLDGLPMGTYNGGAIYEYPSGRLLRHEPLPLEACRRIAAFCEERGLQLNAYTDDELYVSQLGKWAERYSRIAGVKVHEVGSLHRWLAKPCTKMLILDEPGRIEELWPEVQALLGPACYLSSSSPFSMEITSHRATKGTALQWIAATLGVEREQVMAIGDATNDLPMLEWAGTSFAMEHAVDAVKQAATYVAKGGPGLGVVDALERMGLV